MFVNTKKSRFRLLFLIFPILTLCAAACDEPADSLELSDLSAGELEYVTRYVVIERAKAVHAVDPELGNSLLDSLAMSWGDSNAAEIDRRQAEDLPRRALVNRLLVKVLEAEEDSLLLAGRPDRLTAPLSVIPDTLQ
jgi:hypothetical protein